MNLIVKIIFLLFFLNFLFVSKAYLRTQLTGRDFFHESGSLNALENINRISLRSSLLDISFDYRASPAIFIVRPVDKYGLPLMGDSADGMIEGLCYKTSGSILLGNIRSKVLDGLIENYVLSFDMFGATYQDIPFLSMIDFNSSKGFNAKAINVLGGLNYRDYKNILEIELYLIYKYRDPIDYDNRFISKGVGYEYPSDYFPENTNAIPSGKGSYSGIEPYISFSIYGYKLETLGNLNIGIVFAELSKVFSFKEYFNFFLTEFEPMIRYVDKYYNFFEEVSMWATPFNINLINLKFLKLNNYFDFSIFPLRFNEDRVNLKLLLSEALEIGGAISVYNFKNNGINYGYMGYGKLNMILKNSILSTEIALSYNFTGNMIGGIPVKDDFLYSLTFNYRIIE